MTKQSSDVRALARFMSTDENFSYVAKAANHTEKRKRIDELRNKFLTGGGNPSGEFSAENDSWVQKMGADVSDVGNEEFSFLNDTEFDFAAFNRAAKAETGIQAIKRIVATHNVRESAKAHALRVNEVTRRNKARKAEADKEKKDNFVSRPFWY